MTTTIGLDSITRDPRSVVTVGTFDGVHIGHQAIIRYLVSRAREREGKSVVVSFEPHPREVVHGEIIPLLTTTSEKGDVMESLGLDRFVVISFTKEFASLDSEAFVREVLHQKIGLKEIVIGYDHGFGRGRRGNRETLEALGRNLGFTVDIIPAQSVEDKVVSSTQIRRLIQKEGDVRAAAEMLGRNYSLTGQVVAGDKRGRTIGFPTANIRTLDSRKVVPRNGVYAVMVATSDEEGTKHAGMMNIGVRPTVESDKAITLEVHILEFEKDIYGRTIRIEFMERLRDERKFDSVEALKEQLLKDQEHCKKALGHVF